MGVRAFRLSTGLTQKDVGEALEVKRSTVAMWETGKSRPRAEMLLKLANLFCCTTDELLAENTTAPTPNG